MPTITLPEVDLTRVELPKVDLTKVELPKLVEERVKAVGDWAESIELPRVGGERRSGGFPFVPIIAFIAVISAIGAALWLMTSSGASSRVRDTADRTWRKVTRQPTDIIRYDADDDLASLLPSADDAPSTVEDAVGG